jgi:hypothetical protein
MSVGQDGLVMGHCLRRRFMDQPAQSSARFS